MSINDRYKLIDHQLLDGEEITNVYWYQCIDGDGTAEDLAEFWVTDVLGYVRAVQTNQLTHTAIEVINYDELADFYTLDLTSGNAGTRTGEYLPRFNAWGFRLERPTRAIRSGSKRIAGITESDTTSGVANPTFVGTLDDLADRMAHVVEGADTNRYQPNIVSINRETGAIITDVGFTNASYVKITTQNSRKR